MKNIFKILFCLFSLSVSAQETEEIAIKKTIEAFFDGFHQQDSVQIKNTVSNTVIMQTIATDEKGNPLVKTQEFSDFLKSIVSIPESTKFEEVITDYSIQIDGPMANAWTPYIFKIDGAFHHCGVNSFQLVKEDEKDWKIIYIIDTRRKENCK
ncbi:MULTISPECIES: nuclear transport factor 2 family protein [Zobellia]|uniref:nuclear transport factor 2 family protein n=1 Tax=Zobellia TaxID=112040 RepID=UPI001BFF55C3|nr:MULTISPECIES: nuclear transport factor 2 family protein [Zobellia]MBT9188591.1 nuclear transport factor 2 family protein [Zobellia russellii]MBU2976199.1 nuclear transport factor 2 family protein [Zobellia sp. B3R18]